MTRPRPEQRAGKVPIKPKHLEIISLFFAPSRAHGNLASFNFVVMKETPTRKRVIACKLTSPELQKRKAEVIEILKTKILEKQELADGYKYKFAGTDQLLDEITSFIKSERLCCDFFVFVLTISDDEIWLSVTGPDGAKEFIKTEMDL